MEKKYRLTDETIDFYEVKLHRIEALMDFNDVKKGDIGGFIESEKNLSHYGNCWIYNDAKVYEEARVCDNSKVLEYAEVRGCALVQAKSMVYGDAKVLDYARINDKARIFDFSEVSENAVIGGKAKIYGSASICGECMILEHAEVLGNVVVNGPAVIRGNAKVKYLSDFIVFRDWWSTGDYFTWTKSNNMWKVGCFYGTGEELIEKAYKDSELSGREYKRVVEYVKSLLRDEKLKTGVVIQPEEEDWR